MVPLSSALAFALLCATQAPPPSSPPSSLSLADILAEARANNPRLRAARARVKGARASIESATRLPDPSVKGEIWGAPLLAPYALDKADTLMLGVRQEIPLTSFVDAKRDAAAAAVDVESAEVASRARDLESEVSAAFVRYRVARDERALHLEHVSIMETTIEAMRAAQATGRASEADVSAAEVALTMAHGELYGLDADEAAARATLNAWMGRDPRGPLEIGDESAHVAARRPAVVPAVARARADAAMAAAAAQVAANDATLPTIMASVDYWYVPTSRDPHAYGAMLGVSLPWLNFGRSGDVAAARERSDAARAEADAAELDVGRMRVEAAALVDARELQLHTIERDEIPAAQRNVDATQGALAAGATDARGVLAAEAMLLDARIRRLRTRAALDLARIDFARLDDTEPADDPAADEGGAP